MIQYRAFLTTVGGGEIDEIDKIKVTPCEFGATHCVLNGDNFCFS